MIALLTSMALAESWCAQRLDAHEWGVTWLAPAGARIPRVATPAWFERAGEEHPLPASTEPVWNLPADSGIRELPLLQFHGAGSFRVALEVGFRDGEASLWSPAAQVRTPASVANGPLAQSARQVLVQQRQPSTAITPAPRGHDPTRQLHWDRLQLVPAAPREPRATDVPWVQQARQVQALWVDSGEHTDRYVFYEAHTRESPDLVVEQGTEGPNHVILRNVGPYDVHDVVFQRDGRSWTAPRIPSGATAGFLLEDPVDPAATRRWLTERWTTTVPEPAECVMMRRPAVPVETAAGHRLYQDEIELLWSVWADRLLDPVGTRILYREDPAALDERMPISLYTDMFGDPHLSRLGVVVVAL